MSTTKKIFKSLAFILHKQKRTSEDLAKISECLLKIKDLSPYIISFSSISLEELASTLKLEVFEDQDVLFNKGDKSEKLYIIAKGSIWLYEVDNSQTLIHYTNLGPGKILGERGLIRNLPRSLTAICKKTTHLITLELQKFQSIISNQLQSNIEEKINFIEKTFPKTVGFKLYQKERMAYCIDAKQYKRDDIIISENTNCEFLMILFSGECLLEKKNFGRKVKISCIESGCFVADECAFLGEASHFTYKVVTDAAKVYFIKKQHFFVQCPPDLLKRLMHMCKARVRKRDRMTESAVEVVELNETYFKLNNSWLPNIKKEFGEKSGYLENSKSRLETKSMLIKFCRKGVSGLNKSESSDFRKGTRFY